MIRQWVPVWAIPALVLMSIGTVWVRLSIVRTTYSIGQQDHLIRDLKLRREKAELKLAGLRSPRRLERLARTRFHLSQPRPDQVIYLNREAYAR